MGNYLGGGIDLGLNLGGIVLDLGGIDLSIRLDFVEWQDDRNGVLSKFKDSLVVNVDDFRDTPGQFAR